MKRKILILGGESFSIDIVRQAKALDYHVTVASRHDDGDAKRLADEKLTIDLLDYDAIVKFIKGNNIEGVMAGPSEFHTINMINICKMAGLRCYATPEQWARCSNKETFKKYCRKNGVPTAPEYPIEKFRQKEADKDIEYPLIVKPVDACSSKGITICNNREDVLRAYEFALEASESRHAVIEKYLDNGGSIFGFRYILDKGKSYPYLMFDTYIVDPVNKKYLISAFTYFPSHLTDFFWKEIDKPVRKMFLDMGLENGVAFIQAIPYNGQIYCLEMGYRLSGGMIYKITEPLMGINDMQMMTRFAMGGPMITEEETDKINKPCKDAVFAQLMIPLNVGTIARIEGLDEIKKKDYVIDFLQYHQEGDELIPQVMGTLGQHLGRFTLKAENKEEMIEIVNEIHNKLHVIDTESQEMYTMRFDVNRLQKNNL